MNDGRVVIVTGGTSGIGQAVVQQLARSGHRVVASGRRRASERHWPPGLARQVLDHVGDVTHESAAERLFEDALGHWRESPTAFVLCAGRGLPGTVLTSDSREWPGLFELNVTAVARQLRGCAKIFVAQAQTEPKRRVRDIVVIGSTVGRAVSAANPVYGATKFATHALAESLRQEVCDLGIRVSLIEPGFVSTEFQATAGYDPEWVKAKEREVDGFLAPEDVARTIEFVIGQPGHVHLDDIRLRATPQKV